MLPAASWIVAVSSRRVAPEVRSWSRPSARSVSAGTVVDGEGAECSGGEPAGGCSHRDGADQVTPVIVLVATPLAAVALPARDGARPGGLREVDLRRLSQVTVLPAASLIVAVSTRRAPELRSVVAPVRAIWVAAPWTMVKAPQGAGAEPGGGRFHRPESSDWPVIVLVATPVAAVSLPVPLMVPGPEALAKLTTVELSEVTVLPAASWIVAVSTRVAPEVRLVVAPVGAICGGGAVDDREGAQGAGGESAGGGFHRWSRQRPGDRLRRDTTEAVPFRPDRPGAGLFMNLMTVELSEVTVLPAASWIVAVKTRVAPR